MRRPSWEDKKPWWLEGEQNRIPGSRELEREERERELDPWRISLSLQLSTDQHRPGKKPPEARKRAT